MLFINESLINPKTTSLDAYQIDSYACIRQDRTSHGGGNILYYKQHLCVTEVKRNNDLEYFWIDWRVNGKIHYIAIVYRPPSSGTDIFQSLSDDIDHFSSGSPGVQFSIIGDLNMHNADWLGGTCFDNDAGAEGYVFSIVQGLEQIVSECTRSYLHGEVIKWSKPDVFLTDSPDDFEFESVDAHIGSSDHKVVVTKLVKPIRSDVPSQTMIRSYSNIDWDEVNQWLASVDWNSLLKGNVEDCWRNIKQQIHIALDAYAPKRPPKAKKNKPWFTKELRQLLCCKLDAYKVYKQENTATARNLYVAARNNYNKRIRTAKQEHASAMVLKIDRMNGRPWWKTVNSALGRGVKSNIIPALRTNNDLIQDDALKAEHFNKFFAEKSSVPDPDREVESNHTSPGNCPGLRNIHFRPKIVQKLLCQIDVTKAMGLDEIPGIFLKNCCKSLCHPLAKLFQKSFDSGTLPAEWKCSKVTPIHKKGSKTCAANYRPIALLPLISKVMEKYISFHLLRFLEINGKLSDSQFGYRKGHSSVHPLLLLHQFAADALQRQGNQNFGVRHCWCFRHSLAPETIGQG